MALISYYNRNILCKSWRAPFVMHHCHHSHQCYVISVMISPTWNDYNVVSSKPVVNGMEWKEKNGEPFDLIYNTVIKDWNV